MKIVYVAKHGSGDNNDEDAISHSLRQLGHTVICINEREGNRAIYQTGDLCLIHKWEDIESYRRIRMPKVFWYFDLVEFDGDQILRERSKARQEWITRITDSSSMGFCTDGDWVAKNQTGKLVHLMQGLDERVMGYGRAAAGEIELSVLFTGSTRHGEKRMSHIKQLQKKYGEGFTVIGDGGPRTRVHGRELSNIFAKTRIVIAPDGPCTDLYWSNRVYNTIGLGGFLLHPYCQKLTEQYEPDKELVFYKSREELCNLIDRYLRPAMSDERRKIMHAGYARTDKDHLYLNRCSELMRIVKERLF